MKICQKCGSICQKKEWERGKFCDSCYQEFNALDYIEDEIKAFRKKYAGGGLLSAFIQDIKNDIKNGKTFKN